MKRTHRQAASVALVMAIAILVSLLGPARLLPARAGVAAQPAVNLPLVVGGYPPVYTAYLPLLFRKHAPVESLFGVRMQHVRQDYGLAEALQAGVRTVNAVTFSWKEIEPVRTTPPTYTWTSVDTPSLLSAADNGLELTATIHGTPDWAQAIPGYSCGPIAPEQLGAFAEFLQALVARYGGHPFHVRHWALWNEPDVDWREVGGESTFGCWGDGDLPDFGGGAYAQMLQEAYPAIKSAAPEAEVIAGSLLLNDGESISSRFTEGILAGGGGPYFDALSFHVYTYYRSLGEMDNPNWPGSVTAVPEKTGFLRSLLDQYGLSGKPVLSTEASMVILSNNPTPDALETQAMYVPRAYAEALALGLEGLVYYSMTDDWPGRNNGLLRVDLAKKPSYYAYQAASSFLSQAYYRAPAAGYPGGVEGYAFRRLTAGEIDVIWSVDGQVRPVTLPPGAQAYDRYGAGLGGGAIQVGSSPVYVVRP